MNTTMGTSNENQQGLNFVFSWNIDRVSFLGQMEQKLDSGLKHWILIATLFVRVEFSLSISSIVLFVSSERPVYEVEDFENAKNK